MTTIKEQTLQIASTNLADPNLCKTDNWIAGANWQAERMYAEADNIMRFLDTEIELKLSDEKTIKRIKWYFETYFEQFKKKIE